MANSRTFQVVDVASGQQIGTLLLDHPAHPGALVLRFKHDELRIETAAESPPFRGRGGVHDERRKGRTKTPA